MLIRETGCRFYNNSNISIFSVNLVFLKNVCQNTWGSGKLHIKDTEETQEKKCNCGLWWNLDFKNTVVNNLGTHGEIWEWTEYKVILLVYLNEIIIFLRCNNDTTIMTEKFSDLRKHFEVFRFEISWNVQLNFT